MKKYLLTTSLIVMLTQSVAGQIIFKKPLSPRNANYKMNVSLDVEKKQIHGHEILTWRNISKDVIRELQFHLYMNAFKNNRSTFIREQGGNAGILAKKRAWGWIDVNSIKIVGGKDITRTMKFIHPDDNNKEDQTVMQVSLPKSLAPGKTIQVEIDFTTQLPRVYRRNGYYKDFFFAAQWFPKIGVYIDGAWNCHQFHAHSEFFADYGVYDVEITVPKEYIVGATGVLQKTVETDPTKTLYFRAEDVHDFAWTAWPYFKTAEEKYRGIKIRLLYDKDHASSVKRYMNAVKNDIDFFPEWVGKYPFPNITVVDPPTGCMGVGGMEYMTFITGGTYWRLPKGIRIPEMITVHEFGHNYWYGMEGNNEFEEAWLDEGINSYSELKIMDKYYGKETSMFDFLGIHWGEIEQQRLPYIQNPKKDKILRNAWTYIGGGYSTFSYAKPALMLLTLENLVGEETMNRIMKTFFQRWKFKHPHSQDFIDVVNEVTGKDYNWYFDQILKGTNELDYTVASVWTGKEKKPIGVFDRNGIKVTLPELNKDTSKNAIRDTTEKKQSELFKSVVKIYRKGEVIIPVEILVVFANGDSVREVWDGKERWIKYEFWKPARLVFATVDPDHKLVLDSNFSNNSKTVKTRIKPVAYICTRFFYWFETILHFIGFFG